MQKLMNLTRNILAKTFWLAIGFASVVGALWGYTVFFPSRSANSNTTETAEISSNQWVELKSTSDSDAVSEQLLTLSQIRQNYGKIFYGQWVYTKTESFNLQYHLQPVEVAENLSLNGTQILESWSWVNQKGEVEFYTSYASDADGNNIQLGYMDPIAGVMENPQVGLKTPFTTKAPFVNSDGLLEIRDFYQKSGCKLTSTIVGSQYLLTETCPVLAEAEGSWQFLKLPVAYEERVFTINLETGWEEKMEHFVLTASGERELVMSLAISQSPMVLQSLGAKSLPIELQPFLPERYQSRGE
jgi:hypothetical protein